MQGVHGKGKEVLDCKTSWIKSGKRHFHNMRQLRPRFSLGQKHDS